MHVSKITPETMADIWCGMPEETRNDRNEDLGPAYIMKALHPILGAIVIADDADCLPGSGYVLLSELPVGVIEAETEQ